MKQAAFAVLALAVASVAPTVTQTAPTFDVASIKRNMSGGFNMSAGFPPGRFLVRNLSMRAIIAMAYGGPAGFPTDRVLGGPEWLDADKYDIEGKTDSEATEETRRAMARSLLEDRLELKVRSDQRQLPIYALIANSKMGERLRASDGTDCNAAGAPPNPALPLCGAVSPQPTAAGLTLSGRNMEFDQIVRFLQPFVDRPLVNRTKLAGTFSFAVTVPNEGIPGNSDAPGESTLIVSRALQDELGLRLENTRGPVNVLVVDSVQRPSEN